MSNNLDKDIDKIMDYGKMKNDTYSFVSKFRIDNLEFSVFAGTTGCYRVIDKDIENGIKDGAERETFYVDFDQLYDVFSDDVTEEQLRGIQIS